jgi:hypothetical protein
MLRMNGLIIGIGDFHFKFTFLQIIQAIHKTPVMTTPWMCYVRLLIIPSVHSVVTRRSLCVGKLPKERYCGILPYYFDNEEGADTNKLVVGCGNDSWRLE